MDYLSDPLRPEIPGFSGLNPLSVFTGKLHFYHHYLFLKPELYIIFVYHFFFLF